jgi:UPF0716 protein FxsA
MKILGRILALFLIMPVVELGLLMQVDKLIGFWPTIGIILCTGLLGGLLAKREGLSVWQNLNRRMGRGDLPGKEVLDGVIILCAGALLITPGVLTDVIGFLGLLPPSRSLIRKLVLKRIKKAMQRGSITAVGFDAWSTEPDMYGASGASGGSEMNGETDTTWGGERRDVPRHAEEIDEPGPRGDE